MEMKQNLTKFMWFSIHNIICSFTIIVFR